MSWSGHSGWYFLGHKKSYIFGWTGQPLRSQDNSWRSVWIRVHSCRIVFLHCRVCWSLTEKEEDCHLWGCATLKEVYQWLYGAFVGPNNCFQHSSILSQFIRQSSNCAGGRMPQIFTTLLPERSRNTLLVWVQSHNRDPQSKCDVNTQQIATKTTTKYQ